MTAGGVLLRAQDGQHPIFRVKVDMVVLSFQVTDSKNHYINGLKPAEFKIYPAAPHGFHADYRASYRKEAAEDGWNSMQAWFKKYKVLS